MAELTIGELAGRFGLATHVLRHWESVGLLAPARRVGGRRRYGPDALGRVAIIIQGKRLGFGLEQMRAMLHAGDPARRRALLADHHAALLRRIEEARAASEMIEHALSCPAEDFVECPHLLAAVRSLIPPAGRERRARPAPRPAPRPPSG